MRVLLYSCASCFFVAAAVKTFLAYLSSFFILQKAHSVLLKKKKSGFSFNFFTPLSVPVCLFLPMISSVSFEASQVHFPMCPYFYFLFSDTKNSGLYLSVLCDLISFLISISDVHLSGS